jgi:tetratricopeptide (TPR) repeat protein
MEAEIKNYAEARRLFSLILATDSNNASAGLGLALVESACGKHEKAREMFQELHKNHPNDLVILQAFGIFETKQQNMILARDIFQTAASNSNCTVQVWHAWARAEYDYGFYKNALTVLERAQITFPLHKWLVQLAGMTHFKLGEIQEARKKFKRCKYMNVYLFFISYHIYLIYIFIYLYYLVTEGGIFVEPSAYNAYAKMEEQLGNDHLAIELYNDVLRNAPEHIPSIMSLATLQQKNTGRMGGRRIFEQALAKFESLNKGEQLVGDLLFAWGNFEEIHGDLNHAKALYEESTKKAPTKVEAWKALAQIESLLGDLEAARAVLTMASQHCPSEVALLLQLAKIEAKHKNYRHARNACEKALRIDKLNASAWNIR